jgi:Tol biopolymer transport system component
MTMNDSERTHPLGPADRSDRLESWKDIAAFLGRGITTVQRWEQHEGLPVHRLSHAKKGSVFALKSELDEWWRSRAQHGTLHHDATTDAESPRVETSRGRPEPQRSPGSRRRVGSAIAAVLALAVTGFAISQLFGGVSNHMSARSDAPVVPRPLANDVDDELCASLSPGGTEVVYFWYGKEPGLYIISDGAPPRRLATGEAGALNWCGYAKWSPAGDLIAFLTNGESESKNIWLISPTRGKPRLLTSASGIGLAWSPDGQSLAFVDRSSVGEPFSIYAIPVRGGARRRLTTPPPGSFGDTYAAFSPDGRRLAIVRYSSRHQSDVYVVALDDATGERIERLTTGAPGMRGIDWSPDGGTIVFGSHSGLWRISLADARKPTRVAAFNGGALDPTFSRKASPGTAVRLAYQSDITDVSIWRWDPQRREAKKIAASTWYEDFPAVSPAGDRVAFASNRTGENEIWVANIDGSNAQQVTFHRGPVVLAPAWSRDGKHLAFSSEVGGNRDIYVIDADGSHSSRLTTTPSEETNPSWSPDGRWIYFRSDQAGMGQLWKVSPAGGAPTRVTTGEALRGFPSPDGRILYFVRSADESGLWSVPVEGGKEAFITPDVRDGYWAVADSGIFFLVVPRKGSKAPETLKFLAFASGKVSDLPAPPQPGTYLPGFSAARDGRFVIWTRWDSAIRDLMVIDPWTP